jgi:hypothetical protein
MTLRSRGFLGSVSTLCLPTLTRKDSGLKATGERSDL